VVGSESAVTNARRAGASSDVLAFEDFYRREYPRAVRLAFLLTRSGAAAEDVVQEAFAAAHRRFAGIESPTSYLRASVVNGCRRWHRTAARDERRLRRSLPIDTVTEPVSGDLLDAVAALPYRQRAVIVLRYWADCSEQDIARALGCRPGTVKSLASRALTRLREEVEG
jgi:RNA polymerase sigma-70 factor (sigma-E family)